MEKQLHRHTKRYTQNSYKTTKTQGSIIVLFPSIVLLLAHKRIVLFTFLPFSYKSKLILLESVILDKTANP